MTSRLPPQSGGMGAFVDYQAYESVKTTAACAGGDGASRRPPRRNAECSDMAVPRRRHSGARPEGAESPESMLRDAHFVRSSACGLVLRSDRREHLEGRARRTQPSLRGLLKLACVGAPE